MNRITAFLSLVSFLVSCGGASDISTNHIFREGSNIVAEYPAAPEPEKEPEPEPETKKDHTVTGDFYSFANKGSGWGFVKKKGTEPEIYDTTRILFSKYKTYYIDPNRTNKIYLTFDEGYENGYTPQILDTLKAYNVPAAFFITGSYMKEEAELVDRMVAENHIVGNHTDKHPNLHKLADPQKMANEYGNLNSVFFDRYGINMRYMRPPEGEYSERVLAVTSSLGYKTILWSFAYKDWDPKSQKGADYAFNQVTPYLHSGAIILLHAVSKDNTEALPRIIEYARAQGYEFASLDEMGE